MPQDAFTLRHLCKELNQIFSNGKVNRITQPSPDELILTIYTTEKRTQKLLLNVNPSSPRIGVIESEKDSPLTAPNFCMLMRKHLLSAVIKSIELVGFDRIVKITFSHSGEFFDGVEKVLFVELMGRYSNVILTEKGNVLGGNRGINMFEDVVRPLIVGKPYVYPPVGQKKLPSDQELIAFFDNKNTQELAQIIVSEVQGIAQSTAKEIVNDYFEKSTLNFSSGQDFFEHLNDFLFNKISNPCIVKKDQEIVDVLAFPYQTILGEKIYFNSLYKAEEFFFENKQKTKDFNSKKERLLSLTSTALKKAKKRLNTIRAKEKDALNAEENKIKGEMILSSLHLIKQGQKECVLDNYYDQTKIKIELDEFLSPSKNAEKYFKKYNKQKRTLIALTPQKEMAEKEQQYYESVLEELELCEDVLELSVVEKELESVGIIRAQKAIKSKKEEQNLFRKYSVEGFRVFVGRSNLENDKLLSLARANDLWLHAKDYHSSHVIIFADGKEISQKAINFSAQICAYYSKGREGGKTEIVYAKRKDVKKPSRAKLGFVIYDNFKSLLVEPDKHLELCVSKEEKW